MPEPDQWREGKTFLIKGRLEPPFQSIPEALLASLGGNHSQEQDVALSRQRQLRRAPRPASETRSFAITSSPRSATDQGTTPRLHPQVSQFRPFSQLALRPQQRKHRVATRHPWPQGTRLLAASPSTPEVVGTGLGIARPTLTFQRRQF